MVLTSITVSSGESVYVLGAVLLVLLGLGMLFAPKEKGPPPKK